MMTNEKQAQPETFTCEECGGTFDKERSDEEALREAKDIWMAESLEEVAVVCHDCYENIMGPPLSEARKRKHAAGLDALAILKELFDFHDPALVTMREDMVDRIRAALIRAGLIEEGR